MKKPLLFFLVLALVLPFTAYASGVSSPGGSPVPLPSLPLPAAPALLPRPLPDKSPSAMQVVPHISRTA